MGTPTVRQLECFVALTDKLNFRLAAQSCHITQPALSAQIQQLETTLGVALFERSNRVVLPTSAGDKLVAKARSILADLHEFGEYARSFQAPLTGTLRLGVIPTVAPYVLPKAIAQVCNSYPALRVLVREGQTAELLDLLSAGTLDLLLVALETHLGDVTTLPLFQDRFLLAVPEQHRLAGRKRVRESDLHDEQVMLLEEGHCLREQALPICESGGAIVEAGDFRASSLSTLVQMVSAGVAVTLLPEMSLDAEGGSERRLRFIPFVGNGPARTIGLAWRRSSIREDEFRLLGKAVIEGGAR